MNKLNDDSWFKKGFMDLSSDSRKYMEGSVIRNDDTPPETSTEKWQRLEREAGGA